MPASCLKQNSDVRSAGPVGAAAAGSITVAAGSTLVVQIAAWMATSATLTVSGSLNGAYTRIVQRVRNTDPGTLERAEIWTFANSAAGSEVVTVTFSTGTGHYVAFVVTEITGIASSAEATATSTGTGTAATTSAINTTGVNDAIFYVANASFSASSYRTSVPNGVLLGCAAGSSALLNLAPAVTLQNVGVGDGPLTGFVPTINYGGSLTWYMVAAAFVGTPSGGAANPFTSIFGKV